MPFKNRPYDEVFADYDANIAPLQQRLRILECQRDDLLAACKAAFDAMDAYMSLVPTVSQADQELYEVLREAIVKVEGNDA